MPSFLSLNAWSGTPQAKRFTVYNLSAFGSTFGAIDSGLDARGAYPTNRLIWFKGCLLALTGNQIYRSTDTGTTWTSVHTLTNLNSNQALKSGLNIVTVGGVQTVCCFWYTSVGSTWRGAKSINGIDWTTGVVANSFGNNGPNFGRDYVFKNNLYCIAPGTPGFTGTAHLYIFDPSSMSLSQITTTGAIDQAREGGTLIEYLGQLYFAMVDSSTNNCVLRRFTGNSFVTAATTNVITQNSIGWKIGAFVSGSNLYLLPRSNVAAEGFRIYRINPTFTVTQLTTPLPAGLGTGASQITGGTIQYSGMIHTIIDGETNPGSTPIIYLYHSISNTSSSISTSYPWSVYRWEGESTVMTSLGFGGSSLDQLTVVQQTQGSSFFTPSTNRVEIITRSPNVTGIRVSFILYSPSGSATVNIRAFYREVDSTASAETAAYDLTAATLTNPSAGILSGNSVTGLTADNTTIYQVTWAALTDGLIAADAYGLVIEQYT